MGMVRIDIMKNNHRFEALIPSTLHSIPYILQTHVFKAYCALESLYAQKPNLPDTVWDYCSDLIQNDEPKVDGLIAPELLELEDIVDPTSGRDFGPDFILSRGLMPLSYWAMHKKIEELGFPAVFQRYLGQALEQPRFLGHEISVLAGNWQFYADVIADNTDPDQVALFQQRFTEFATTTFAQGNATVFDHPTIEEVPSDAEILKEALHSPSFFGHHVLAFVWSQRIRSIMTDEQYETTRYNLTVLNRWHQSGRVPTRLEPLSVDWDDKTLDEHLTAYFLDGPTNIHQITLAEALLWVWNEYPACRRLVAANIVCFTQGTQPPQP